MENLKNITEEQAGFENKYGELVFMKKPNLEEVSKDLFLEKGFGKGDVVLIDNDETLTPTLEKLILGESLADLPRDSKTFLQDCKENDVSLAIVTNMPRQGHYLNTTTPVFGYEYYYKNNIAKKGEFFLTLLLGSLYKQTDRCLVETSLWSTNQSDEKGGRIAWVGNSYLDTIFAKSLSLKLRDFDYNEDLYFYKLPPVRSFRKQ